MGQNPIDKKVIQSVSGVGADIADLFTAAQMHYFAEAGLLVDVTDVAAEMGFGPDSTYPVLLPEITRRDPATGELRQFTYPLNLGGFLFFANEETFAAHGRPMPPVRWTIEEFERQGRAFVAAANADRGRRVFFANIVDPWSLRRSLGGRGGSAFNETLTRCTLDSPESVQTLRILRRWTHELRLIPSQADMASMTGRGGLFGDTGLWYEGRYGLIWSSRHLLIQARLFNRERVEKGLDPLRVTMAEPPHSGFPNTTILVRTAGVYTGSEHPQLVREFLAYLASDEYGGTIVRDADALPPNPAVLTTQAYLRPELNVAAGIYPETEWPVHGAFAEACLDLGVASSYSPFVQRATVDRIERRWREAALAAPPKVTPEQAAANMARDINAEIEATLARRPELRAYHQRLTRLQAEIDRRRVQGLPVDPASLLNPYHRALAERMKARD
jgi:ABC-type glycerol-3-phosphate transport system substrate-binding protein